MALDFAVRMLQRRLQNDFIPRSFRTALEIIILVTFRFFASAAIGCDGFAAMDRFKPQRNLLVRILSLLGL